MGTLLISFEMRLSKSYGSGCDLDQTPRSDGFLRMTGHTNVKFWCVSISISVSDLNIFLQTTATHQVSVENLPDVKGYATSDAFIKHPTVDGLWKMYD